LNLAGKTFVFFFSSFSSSHFHFFFFCFRKPKPTIRCVRFHIQLQCSKFTTLIKNCALNVQDFVMNTMLFERGQ
jgi:hypothetical protein